LTAQNRYAPKQEEVSLKGRVLADVASLTFGAGVGPQYQKFIFGVESKNLQGQTVITPVEILYAFFKDQGPLRDEFFDHSKVYELNVVRDSQCDQTLSNLSYVRNSDETGKELPATRILQVLYGAPHDALKPDAILPCYVLHGREYKVLHQDAERISRCFVRVPQELQDKVFTVVYRFETKNGKPVNITRVNNEYLKDDEFTACITRWTVTSLSQGLAVFTWNAAEGWMLSISEAFNTPR
jgi:hypothetical protein